MAQWYIVFNGEQIGPMEENQLLAYGLNANSQVWTEGMPQWAPAYTLPDLMSLIAENQAPANMNQQMYGGNVPPYAGMNQGSMQSQGYASDSGKSKVTAGILAMLLGALGIQYFYLGKVGGGIITILLSCITCFAIWPIITFVQGIVMLTMSDEEFDRKFVNTNSTFPLF